MGRLVFASEKKKRGGHAEKMEGVGVPFQRSCSDMIRLLFVVVLILFDDKSTKTLWKLALYYVWGKLLLYLRIDYYRAK